MRVADIWTLLASSAAVMVIGLAIVIVANASLFREEQRNAINAADRRLVSENQSLKHELADERAARVDAQTRVIFVESKIHALLCELEQWQARSVILPVPHEPGPGDMIPPQHLPTKE